MSKEIALSIRDSEFEQFGVYHMEKSFNLGEYLLTVYQFRDVKNKLIVSIPVVYYRTELLFDEGKNLTKVFPNDYVQRKDIPNIIKEELNTLLIKRRVLLNSVRMIQELTSILHISCTKELVITYLTPNKNVIQVTPNNGELFLDISEKEFSILLELLKDTGVTLNKVSEEQDLNIIEGGIVEC